MVSVNNVPIKIDTDKYRSGQAYRRYGNSGARRSFRGPIGVGGASVVPGLCWETRTSLYRLRWRRRVVPGSRLGRYQPRHGGRRRWRYSAKLRIQYRRMRFILSADRLTLPPLPLIVPEYLFSIPFCASSLFFFLSLLAQPSSFLEEAKSFMNQKFLLLFFSLFFLPLIFQSVLCYLSSSQAPVLGWYQFWSG